MLPTPTASFYPAKTEPIRAFDFFIMKNKAFREIISGNYRIIYKYENDEVVILIVRHGKQVLPIDEWAG